jgi:hypothetical protein
MPPCSEEASVLVRLRRVRGLGASTRPLADVAKGGTRRNVQRGGPSRACVRGGPTFPRIHKRRIIHTTFPY